MTRFATLLLLISTLLASSSLYSSDDSNVVSASPVIRALADFKTSPTREDLQRPNSSQASRSCDTIRIFVSRSRAQQAIRNGYPILAYFQNLGPFLCDPARRAWTIPLELTEYRVLRSVRRNQSKGQKHKPFDYVTFIVQSDAAMSPEELRRSFHLAEATASDWAPYSKPSEQMRLAPTDLFPSGSDGSDDELIGLVPQSPRSDGDQQSQCDTPRRRSWLPYL